MSASPAIIPQAVEPRAGEANAYQFGKIYDEAIDVYHACGAISKSKLDVFRQSPRLFWKRYIAKTLPNEKSEALILGSAIDAFALEGKQAFDARFVIVPDDAPKKPTQKQREAKKQSPQSLEAIAFWDKFGAEAKGKEVLTDKQAAVVQRCCDALANDPTWSRFMQFGKSQVTFRLRGDRFAMQCRPDRWLEEGCDLTDGMPAVVDLKTCSELPCDVPEHLERHIQDFGYHRGAYLYPEIIATVMKYKAEYRPPFILTFVEKAEPHAVVTRVVSDDAVDIGKLEVGEALVRLRKCMAEGYWPTTWDDPMTPIGLTGYYSKRARENTDGNLWG